MRHVLARAVIASTAAMSVTAAPASGQSWSNRASIELVGAVTQSSADPGFDPFIVIDGTATVRVTSNFDVIVRPYFRRLPGGDWAKEMYQLQVRYQPASSLPFRIDAGIISSPLGIIALEMRPDRNPIIGSPSYYFSPLPSFDGRFDRVQLLSGGYPLGIVASASGRHWDARAGITDGTPTRNRRMMSTGRPPAEPQFVTGGGWTPFAGLRIGSGFGHGVYRTPTVSSPLPLTQSASATVLNLEGEYAVGYTRVAGEWIMDRFETATTPAVVRGYLLEGVRTITPRWYAAGRTTRVSTPMMSAGARVRRVGSTADATIGFRVSREITLKGGYQGSRTYSQLDWEHAAALSIVWSRRWW